MHNIARAIPTRIQLGTKNNNKYRQVGCYTLRVTPSKCCSLPLLIRLDNSPPPRAARRLNKGGGKSNLKTMAQIEKSV